MFAYLHACSHAVLQQQCGARCQKEVPQEVSFEAAMLLLTLAKPEQYVHNVKKITGAKVAIENNT